MLDSTTVIARGMHTLSKKVNRGSSLCNYDGNASVMYFLEHEDGGHGGKTKSTVHRAQSRSGTLLATAGALGLGVGAGNVGVDELALAEELALDELLVPKALVRRANGGHVLGRLEVEGTGHVVKLGSFNAVID
jgi:hypothetical protein